MLKKGDIVVRTEPFTANITLTIEQHKGAIFEVTKDSANDDYAHYGECYNTLHWRKAKRLEKIAYRRGLRNINNISWNTPLDPHFAVSLVENSMQDPMLRHTAYKEICEYLGFGSQYYNYDECTYAGYKHGSARTWTHSPNFEGMKFPSVLKFVDYVFEHWMIIDLLEDVPAPVIPPQPMGVDSLDAKDWCVMVVGQEQYDPMYIICSNNNIPLAPFDEEHHYYGVHHGISICEKNQFINNNCENFYISYFEFKGDKPGVRYGSDPEPIEIQVKAEPYVDTSRDYCVFAPVKAQYNDYAYICGEANVPYPQWQEGYTHYGVFNGEVYCDSDCWLLSTRLDRYYTHFSGFREDEPEYKYGRKPKRERDPTIHDYIGKYFVHEDHENPIYLMESVTDDLVLITWKGTGSPPSKYTTPQVLKNIKNGTWKLVDPPIELTSVSVKEVKEDDTRGEELIDNGDFTMEDSWEIKTHNKFPEDGFVRADTKKLRDFLLNRHPNHPSIGDSAGSHPIGIAWNSRCAWVVKSGSSKHEYTWTYIEQLINNLSNNNKFSNNQLKNSKNENVFRKTSGSTQRRSNDRTRQTSVRRKPNSTTERCSGNEKRIRPETKRVGQILGSKRNRL